MDRRAWQATVDGATKSWTRLSNVLGGGLDGHEGRTEEVSKMIVSILTLCQKMDTDLINSSKETFSF